ncbi:Serine/threonine-protein kinase PknD [Oopsacas minuta]|uniref:Serine/threonine-protein kinase PknD n=1 Tax=Oopsacas minuta TaxID=111878 RepID=A0AAV7K760_9METZ|nr:Serine/threonine-protein kinase PknD [Oopsacas minuta]
MIIIQLIRIPNKGQLQGSAVMACNIEKISNLPESELDLGDVQTKLDMLQADGELRKIEITDHFRTLHEDLNRREELLLASIDEIVQTTSVNVTAQKENLERYRKAKHDAEKIFENNQLVEILKETIDKIQLQIDELLGEQVELPEIELKWNINQAQECVANFCEILQLKHPYSYRRTTVWSSGKEGIEQDKLKSPFGITIDPDTELIYVADCNNNRVQVFTQDGDYMKSINVTANHPRSLVTHGTHCYVTCDNWILKLETTKSNVLSSQKVNHDIRGLDFYKGRLYVCELEDYYIYVFDTELVTLEKIKLTSEHLIEDKYGLYHAYQFDVKIVDNVLYILFANCSYPLQCFSMTDEKNNFLLTDRTSHQIKVFSREGLLLGKISQKGLLRGQLKKPMGIALDKNNRIIVCDQKVDNILQCF